MATPGDHFELYYADRIWGLLPEVYRSEDSASFDKKGPLRELVDRLGAQAAVVRRSIDRLWDDAYIETCDDWLIPYMADLLATNLVASLDARGQRLDVARTIYYRRRKGTVPILEQIASDITGWEAKVVEFFRLLGRTRHGLDPAIGLPMGGALPDPLQKAAGLVAPNTHTPMGGFADIRNHYGASRAATAFDEFAHTADLRRGRGATGWHNISRLGVFVWRLKSYGVDQTTPVPITGCTDWYTFDPTGRDIPVFAAASRKEAQSFGDRWAPPEEWQMPGPIDDPLWAGFQPLLYPSDEEAARSVSVYRLVGAAGFQLIDPAVVKVLPERGRFKAATTPLFGVYHYGFSSDIGAGPYDRRRYEPKAEPAPVLPSVSGGGLIAMPATGTLEIADSFTYGANSVTGVTKLALTAENEKRPVIRMTPGTELHFTGTAGAELTISGILISGCDLVLDGTFEKVTLRCVTLDPGTAGQLPNVFATSADARPLIASRIFVEGQVRSLEIQRSIAGPVRTRNNGVIQSLTISDSIVQGLRHAAFGVFGSAEILDPVRLAIALKAAATPLTAQIAGALSAGVHTALAAWNPQTALPATVANGVRQTLNVIVTGPAFFSAALFTGVRLSPDVIALRNTNPTGATLARLNRLLLEEAFPYALADAAVAQPDGEASLQRTTVLGRMYVHRLAASESILDDIAWVDDTQHGCIRFSAWSSGSVLPRQYESVRISAQAPIFATRVFGQPAYTQLLDAADLAIQVPATGGSILEGAENGSEMGAFSGEKNAIKERSLLIKFEEFMPIGLSPVVVHVT